MLTEHAIATAVVMVITGFAIGFYGGLFKRSGPVNTAKAGVEEENLQVLKKIKPAYIDNSEMQEYVKLMMRKEVQKEIKKHNIDSVVRSDVQKYQQGEVQGVLTPELLEAMIASSMEKAMDKYHEQLDEKIEYLLDRNIKKHPKNAETEIEINERLKKIEEILLQKEMGSTFDALILVPVYKMKTSISVNICNLCNFFSKTVLDVIVCKVPNFLEKAMELLGIYESDPIVVIQPVCRCLFCSIINWLVMCLCYCLIHQCLIVKRSLCGSMFVLLKTFCNLVWKSGSPCGCMFVLLKTFCNLVWKSVGCMFVLLKTFCNLVWKSVGCMFVLLKTFCNLVWKSGRDMVFMIESYALLSFLVEYLGFGILVIIGCIIIMQNRSQDLREGGSKGKSTGQSKGELMGGLIDDQSLVTDIKRQYKKLENSMCVVSYSTDYVEKYHVPLAKTLMEYSNRKDLRIKRAIIREPENLNSIPPSKIFIVFVDYNERNDLLEPVNPKAEQVPIRRETVRSLMDSMALVIFTYCMEQSSKKLPHGDRYAHKLSSKVLTIPELKELDEKKCVYSVYDSFNHYQLGIMKQIIEDYLKHF